MESLSSRRTALLTWSCSQTLSTLLSLPNVAPITHQLCITLLNNVNHCIVEYTFHTLPSWRDSSSNFVLALIRVKSKTTLDYRARALRALGLLLANTLYLALHHRHLTNSSCCIVALSQSNMWLSLFVAFLIDSGTFSIHASISFGFRTLSVLKGASLHLILKFCLRTSN